MAKKLHVSIVYAHKAFLHNQDFTKFIPVYFIHAHFIHAETVAIFSSTYEKRDRDSSP